MKWIMKKWRMMIIMKNNENEIMKWNNSGNEKWWKCNDNE